MGNERQGLKPALAHLLGSRACPSHREAVRRAGRPPALPRPSPARPPESGLREHGPGYPSSPPASLQSHHTICQWLLASEHPHAASPLASRMQLPGQFSEREKEPGSGFSGFWPPRGHVGRAEGPTWGGPAVLDSGGGFSKLSWTRRFSLRAVPRSGLSDIPSAVGSPFSSHPHHTRTAQWNPSWVLWPCFPHPCLQRSARGSHELPPAHVDQDHLLRGALPDHRLKQEPQPFPVCLSS